MVSDSVIIWVSSIAVNLFLLHTKKEPIWKLVSVTLLFLAGLAAFLIENSEISWLVAGTTLIILAVEIVDILWRGKDG